MITLENLAVRYANGGNVIDSLSLTLSHGCIHGLVGLNGAGKTTLLNAIYGLKPINSGAIMCNGGKLKRKDMSFLATESYFYPNITGREYLGLFENPHFNMDEWNKLFLLPLDTVIDNYSSGMKKKLALLGVLRQDKPIMILDEPFNNLDIETCGIIRQILTRIRDQGKTIIVTSHIIETLTNLCDFIHYLKKGRILFSTGKENFERFESELHASLERKNRDTIGRLLGG